MKVSIIVPVYNVSPYIIRCLESIKAQTYKDFEVIIVDDCGSDDSVVLAKEFIAKNKLNWQLLHHEKNRGLSAARNTGLQAASGEYVYFLDSDDEIVPYCLEHLAAPLSERKYDFIMGDYIAKGGDEEGSMLRHKGGAIVGNENIVESYAKGEWYVMAWNKLCSRSFLLDNSLYFAEGVLHEDVIWSFMLMSKAKSIYVVDSVTYIYYIRGASIMTGMSIEKDVEVYIKAYQEINSFVKANGIALCKWSYQVVEGKKCGIQYSLLQCGEYDTFKKSYPKFHSMPIVNPLRAFFKGIIPMSLLVRDLHYAMPCFLGVLYKRLFFNLVYKWRGKSVQGLVWKK